MLVPGRMIHQSTVTTISSLSLKLYWCCLGKYVIMSTGGVGGHIVFSWIHIDGDTPIHCNNNFPHAMSSPYKEIL